MAPRTGQRIPDYGRFDQSRMEGYYYSLDLDAVCLLMQSNTALILFCFHYGLGLYHVVEIFNLSPKTSRCLSRSH